MDKDSKSYTKEEIIVKTWDKKSNDMTDSLTIKDSLESQLRVYKNSKLNEEDIKKGR